MGTKTSGPAWRRRAVPPEHLERTEGETHYGPITVRRFKDHLEIWWDPEGGERYAWLLQKAIHRWLLPPALAESLALFQERVNWTSPLMAERLRARHHSIANRLRDLEERGYLTRKGVGNPITGGTLYVYQVRLWDLSRRGK